jgi:hypothetical protein
MLTQRLEDLRLADIERLKDSPESRFLDFKSAPVGSAEKDRREFVADVTAFANAAGGEIVFGVATKDGVASDVTGITLADPDKEKLRLGDLIRTATEPRLTNFDMEWLPMEGNIGVLIVRIPRSWIAPHRVTLQGHDKFYVRNPAGKHPMNVDELRQAFTLSQSVAERIRAFRTDRVRMLLADKGPFPLPPPVQHIATPRGNKKEWGVRLIFHVVPLKSFVDPPDLRLAPGTAEHLRPLGVMGYSWRYTLDGYANYNDNNGMTYALGFRNGVIEAVARVPKDENLIFASRIEKLVLEGWNKFKHFFVQHGIGGPFFAFVTVTDVKGVALHVSDTYRFEYSSVPYRQDDHLLLSELTISDEQLDQDAHVVFRPLFDILANAFGLPRSFSYAGDGSYELQYQK